MAISRPPGLMINTSHLDKRPLYELPALVAHEGAPGHHIQIALGEELTTFPSFRQQSDFTAFVEGWTVYAEQLVAEMGLYPSPYECFGMLSMEMWRACRLAMDVGLHAGNFSRHQALACLRENTALSEQNMQNEVDRYIAWPGQALGYKIGELKILERRNRAEAALGENSACAPSVTRYWMKAPCLWRSWSSVSTRGSRQEGR